MLKSCEGSNLTQMNRAPRYRSCHQEVNFVCVQLSDALSPNPVLLTDMITPCRCYHGCHSWPRWA